MTPDRLQQIEQLYYSVRNASHGERAALLDCADPVLRREVESLLARQNDPVILDRSLQVPCDATLTVLSAGAFLGPYQVESKLGEGGMGEVFRAVDTRLGRPVAIKFVHEQFSARFEREARAISSLNHPHICTLYDIGANYLVMELLAGDTLATVLKVGPLPVDRALRYAVQIVSALAEAHACGIVHRDLKPGNIMVSKSGGEGPGLRPCHLGRRRCDHRQPHAVMGTPAYIALREQREGKTEPTRAPISIRSAASFMKCWTGVRATPSRKPAPSKALERILARCLETDPEKRWRSATDLAAAIEAAPPKQESLPWLVAATAILATLLIAGWLLFHPARKLTARDTIVLADFVNDTGDAIFDDTLRQASPSNWNNRRFSKIMDDEQMHGALSLMSLPSNSRITNRIAHDVCVRKGTAATIGGAIGRLGRNYVITLQAITCQDGTTLSREQIQAEDKEHVLTALGTAVTAMRRKLGESLTTIRRLNRPLEQATTSSLEALQSYSAGVSEISQGQFLGSVPLFERAVALDPSFAMAYEYLATAYDNAGDMPKRFEYARKAFGLIDRVSDLERDEIAASYYEQTGELDKAIGAYRSSVRNYPRYWASHNNLSVLLIEMGQFEEGLAEGLEASRLEPDVEPPYRRQMDAYLCLDRPSDARKVMDRLRTLGLGGPRIHQRFLEIGYVDDDDAVIQRETQWFAGKPGEYLSLGLQAANRNTMGQRRESHKLYHRAAETALRLGLQNAARELDEADAQSDALIGDCQTVRTLGRDRPWP